MYCLFSVSLKKECILHTLGEKTGIMPLSLDKDFCL